MSTATATTGLPAGWSVELLGLSGSVLFTKDHRQIMWCDGGWHTIITNARGEHVMPAAGIPRAATMAEARRVGSAWLTMVEIEAI